MNQASPAELRDRTRSRDATDVRTYEVRFTDVDSFLQDLKHDAAKIEDGIVRLAVVNRPATDQQVSDAFGSGFNPHGDRHNPLYKTKCLEASYLVRGQLVKLSRDCGIALAAGVAERFGQEYADAGVEHNRKCAEALLEVANKVQKALDDMEGLDLRGGGLYVEDGPWRSDIDHAIEQLPQERCATCNDVIYYANAAWRHKSTRRAEALKPGVGFQGRGIKQLDHLADPIEKGRLV